MDAIKGLQPMDDSLGLWWRPDLLGSAFSGQSVDDFMRESQRLRRDGKARGFVGPHVPPGITVPDVGADGAARLVSQTMKYAHPRDRKSFCLDRATPAEDVQLK